MGEQPAHGGELVGGDRPPTDELHLQPGDELHLEVLLAGPVGRGLVGAVVVALGTQRGRGSQQDAAVGREQPEHVLPVEVVVGAGQRDDRLVLQLAQGLAQHRRRGGRGRQRRRLGSRRPRQQQRDCERSAEHSA